MNAKFSALGKRLALAAMCLPFFGVIGCEDKIGKCYPVNGVVLLDGKPMIGNAGTIFFKPDVSKGNTTGLEAIGNIDSNGLYSLSTQGKEGALPGWYKVVVSAYPSGIDDQETVKQQIIHPRFASPGSTPLTIEVVPDAPPSAYDLQVSKK